MLLILSGILAAGLCLDKRGGDAAGQDEDAYDDLIFESCQKYMPSGWDWLILKGLIKQESKFDPRASSGNTAGLMQFTSGTAKSVGLPPQKRDNPDLAVPAGVRYMRKLWDVWQDLDDGPPAWNRTKFALASYNAGPGRVRQAREGAGGTSSYDRLEQGLPSHTQNHVAHVMEFFKEYRKSGRYRRSSGSLRRRNGSVRFWINPMKQY